MTTSNSGAEFTTPGFEFDRFQLEAIAELDRGRSVLVAAPTGAGKTVVADAAIDMALHAGGRAFYTTPIKALSNQKYHDLVARLGAERVGLLTGDISLNGGAPVVVMTTEVLRNMMYGGSPGLRSLHVVVLDEVHYLQDTYRGPVWEEVIIGLAAEVRLVCLSATISNATELGEWIEVVRGPTATVIETERPVELHPLYAVADRSTPEGHLIPVLMDGQPNAEGRHFDGDPRLARRRGPRGAVSHQRFRTPRRDDLIDRLANDDLLPVIYFIFSRAACTDAAAALRDAHVRLTTSEERREIRAIMEAQVERLSDSDLDALGYDRFAVGMEAGIAAHHAGMVPAFREAVEACFVRGLVKVVFATETLALGINMPARSVVIEKLTKFNGETHEFLTAGQFTQLTGRAGRRGIDDVGFAVVCWSPFITFDQVARLAASRSFPLSSSFRPTYNMAVNLVRRYDHDDAMRLLGLSFAQFQADRAVVGLARRAAEDAERLAHLEAVAADVGGELDRYATLVATIERTAGRGDRSRVAIDQSIALLRPGQVVVVDSPVSEAHRPAVVITAAYRGRQTHKIGLVDGDGNSWQIRGPDVHQPIRPVAEIELPVPYEPQRSSFIDGVAALLGELGTDLRAPAPLPSPRLARLIEERDGLALHADPRRDVRLEAHAEANRLRAELHRLQRRLERDRGSIVRRFEGVFELLGDLGAVDGWSLTALGERLSRTYHESDLLVALAEGHGIFDGLEAAELASILSALTFEERREGVSPPRPPTRRVASRLADLDVVWERLSAAERTRGLPETRRPDRGFTVAAWSWASGADLAELIDDDLTGGDFVRHVKLLIDLLRQLGDHAGRAGTAASARAAAEALGRGVVAASSTPAGRPVGPVGPGR